MCQADNDYDYYNDEEGLQLGSFFLTQYFNYMSELHDYIILYQRELVK